MRGFMAGLSPGADADMSAMLGPHDGRGLRERLPDTAIMTNGAGNYATWLHRFWRFRRFGTQVAPKVSISLMRGLASSPSRTS